MRNKSKRANGRSLLLLITFCLFSACTVDGGGKQAQSLEEANLAYDRYDYSNALEGYTSFWKSKKGDAKDRVQAAQKLAYLGWRVESKIALARKWTKEAQKLSHDLSGSLSALSRFEMQAGNYEKSLQLAREAQAAVVTEFDSRNASEQFVLCVYSWARDEIQNRGSLQSIPISEATDVIAKLVVRFPEDLELAKLSVGIALLNERVEDIFLSWKKYYRINDHQDPGSLLETPYVKLNQLADENELIAELDDKERLELVMALADSRLFEFARLSHQLLIGGGKTSLASVNDALNYSRYLVEVEAATYAFYKKIAAGKENRQAFRNELEDIAEKYWGQFGNEAKGLYQKRKFNDLIAKLFGARPTEGIVNGYYAYYIGHKVFDESQSVKQYKHRAKLDLITLDNVTGNDYSGWFHDAQRVAGTANRQQIISYRQAVLQEPVMMWNNLTDPTKREQFTRTLKRLVEQDKQTANTNPYALLPGLRLQIIMDKLQYTYDSLKGMGLHETEVKFAFIEHFRTFGAASLVNHEGRHAIDYRIGGFSSNELEYRAKLSEIAFSKEPLVMMAAAVMRQEAAQASHGKANEKLMTDIVKWVEENESQVADFEQGVPHVLQLGKLTDQQVVQIMRFLDPLAK